jgi:hypothetical protein
MEDSRCNAIEHVVSELHRLLRVYRDFDYSCPHSSLYSFQCGAILFGALMKHMESWGYLSPRPRMPFTHMSLNNLCDRIKKTRSSCWWYPKDTYRGTQYEPHPCDLYSQIGGIVQNAMAKVSGLKLQGMKEIGIPSSALGKETVEDIPTAAGT